MKILTGRERMAIINEIKAELESYELPAYIEITLSRNNGVTIFIEAESMADMHKAILIAEAHKAQINSEASRWGSDSNPVAYDVFIRYTLNTEAA